MARRAKAGDSKTAIGYLRVSTDEQRLGPEAQRASIEAWAAREGVSVVAWHVDQGVSGATPIDGRSGLCAALAALHDHGAGVLVVAKRDRVARDVELAAVIGRAVSRAGARLASADGTCDATGPEGAMMRGIFDVFAEYERGLIRARTTAALAAKKARGERTGSAPFGYRLASDGKKLERDEREQAVIARANDLRASGLSTRAIVRALGTEGITSPRSGRPLNQTQVVRALREHHAKAIAA
ncbi:hypothetical protein BH11MYX4_BH11MYX4_01840 [soil metagenome]